MQVKYDVAYEDAGAAAAASAALNSQGQGVNGGAGDAGDIGDAGDAGGAGGAGGVVVASSFTLAVDEGISAETLAQDATFRDNLARAV